MHDEQQRQPDARTQQVLGRVRHIINKKNTQFILDHQHDSLAALHGGYRPSARAGRGHRR